MQGRVLLGLTTALGVGVVAVVATRSPDANTTPPGAKLRVGWVDTLDPAASEALTQGFALASADLEGRWGESGGIELVRREARSPDAAVAALDALAADGVHLVVDLGRQETLTGCVQRLRKGDLVVLQAAGPANGFGASLGGQFFSVPPSGASGSFELGRWVRELHLTAPLVFASPGRDGEIAGFQRGLQGGARLLELRDDAQVTWAAQQAEASGADAVIAFVDPERAGKLQRALVASSSTAKVFGLSGCGGEVFRAAAGGAGLERVLFVEEERVSEARAAAVEAAWRARFGQGRSESPAPAVFWAYDALSALADAARPSGGEVRDTVRRLYRTRLDGATGLVAFADGERAPAPVRRMTYTDAGVPVPCTPSWEVGK